MSTLIGTSFKVLTLMVLVWLISHVVLLRFYLYSTYNEYQFFVLLLGHTQWCLDSNLIKESWQAQWAIWDVEHQTQVGCAVLSHWLLTFKLFW